MWLTFGVARKSFDVVILECVSALINCKMEWIEVKFDFLFDKFAHMRN